MTEAKDVWPHLRDAAKGRVHWERIENLVGSGRPDVNGCHGGVTVDIENKVYDGNKLKFRISQPPWITKRCLAGGRVFVLARKKDTFYLYHGARVNELVAFGIKTEPLLVMPMPWDWPKMLEIIFGHKIF
jgi:hypothetical protein